MTKPFFSIILATRDRPQLVRLVLLSLEKQNYKNFELILSDNYISKSCHHIYDEFKDKINIKYTHPQTPLSMADNYEHCLSFVKGDYVVGLEDKTSLFPFSLSYLAEIIKKEKVEIINFNFDCYKPSDTDFETGVWTPSYNIYPGEQFDALAFFKRRITFPVRYKNQITKDRIRNKFLFGCWSVKLLNRIKEKHIVFQPFSPDYTSMTLGSIYTKTFSYDIGKTLGLMVVSDKHSNGIMTHSYSKVSKKFQQESDPENEFEIHCPLKGCMFLISVGLATDFVAIIHQCGLSNKLKINKDNLIIVAREELTDLKDLSKEERLYCESVLAGPSFWTKMVRKIHNYFYKNYHPFYIILYLKVNILGRLGLKKYQLLLQHRKFSRSYHAAPMAFYKILEMTNNYYAKESGLFKQD